MELYLIRHGESVGNVSPGQDLPDCPLTKRGEEQARLVVQGLMEAEITHILSSPLIRALQTAQPFARAVNKPIIVMKDAYEVRHLDSCTGAKLSDLLDQFPEAEFGEDFEPNGWHYQGNENPAIIIKRVSKIAEQLKEYHEEAKIALFAHGTLNQYLIRELIGLSDSKHVRFYQENTCINWFTITKDFTRVNKIGDVHHLQGLAEVR